jgi:protein phosphatase
MDVYTCIIIQPQQESLQLSCLTELPEGELSDQVATEGETLDPGKRYHLLPGQDLGQLKPFAEVGEKQLYAVSVMDSRPRQKYYLDSILETVEEIDRESLIRAGIPPLAFPYLTLAEFYPLIPELLDAWYLNETRQELIIIPLTDKWQLLSQLLETNHITRSQIFGYLEQMARLWKELSKVHYCQTLLEETNLGIDEDRTLTIKYLYPDDPENPPQLRQLVETWLSLLEKAGSKEVDLIIQLLDLIKEGKIENIQQLCSHLQTCSREVQLDSLLTEQEENLLLVTSEQELEALSAQFDNFEDHQEEESTVVSKDMSELDEQPTIVLPMRLLNLTDSGYTDIGRKRTHNEDFFVLDSQIHKQENPQGTKYECRGLYIVCDGMGGHAAGEVASAMAVKNLHQYFQQHWQDELPDKEVIRQGILQANQTIYDANVKKGNTGSGRMGTTLVMSLIQGTKVAIAHVGDSRIYRVTRKWGLEQLTVDHSVAETEIYNGVSPKIAYSRPDAFQLTQALGPRNNNFVHPDITTLEFKEDTLLLLCSDGLCDNRLLEDNWQTYLIPLISSKANLDEGLVKLVDLANQVNGHDNITAVMVRIKVQPNLERQKALL